MRGTDYPGGAAPARSCSMVSCGEMRLILATGPDATPNDNRHLVEVAEVDLTASLTTRR
jgi:hypothetical protein